MRAELYQAIADGYPYDEWYLFVFDEDECVLLLQYSHQWGARGEVDLGYDMARLMMGYKPSLWDGLNQVRSWPTGYDTIRNHDKKLSEMRWGDDIEEG